MPQKVIQSSNAPAPVGPYVQAIENNNLIFCSGQIALDPATGNLVGQKVSEQTVQVMKNISAVLQAAGLEFKNIIKTTIFLTDMQDFAEVNKIYEELLAGHKPARSTIAVSALPKGAKIEIECIASRA